MQRQLVERRFAVLQAPPGTGKTTLLPQSLLPLLPGGQSIVMLHPRRIAAVHAASRIASLLEEQVRYTVGYSIRFERRISARTRIEIVTEGILTARLQRDPELTGVGLVIFDEFYERSLQSDPGLAFALEAATLREDLPCHVGQEASTAVHLREPLQMLRRGLRQQHIKMQIEHRTENPARYAIPELHAFNVIGGVHPRIKVFFFFKSDLMHPSELIEIANGPKATVRRRCRHAWHYPASLRTTYLKQGISSLGITAPFCSMKSRSPSA